MQKYLLFCQSENKSWREATAEATEIVCCPSCTNISLFLIPRINIFLSKHQELEGGVESTEIICCPSLTKALRAGFKNGPMIRAINITTPSLSVPSRVQKNCQNRKHCKDCKSALKDFQIFLPNQTLRAGFKNGR